MVDKKKILIASALTSSLGIFISKFLGIIYVVPFTRLVGESNIAFYTYAYTIYDYLLTLSMAGLPFAISMVVSKYYTKGDYQTVLLVKKVARNLLLALGFSFFIFLVLFAEPIAHMVSPTDADLQYLNNVKMVMYIISVALIFVPFLSYFRGYYQGQKIFTASALSEIIEQLARVIFLLVSVVMCVLVFKLPGHIATFWAVGSAAVAAVVALIYFSWYDRKNKGKIEELAKNQLMSDKNFRMILIEIIICALPFLLASLIGEANGVINSMFFNRALSARGASIEYSTLVYSMLNFSAYKITSIPQVLAIGFGVAIIPVLTSSIINKDFNLVRKQINDAFNSSSFIAIPVTFCIIYFSSPIYALFYGYENYLLGGEVLVWASLLAITGSVFPLASSMMMATNLRKKYFISLIVGFVIKLSLTYQFVYWFDYPGAMITSAMSATAIFLLNLYFLNKKYQVSYKPFLLNVSKMLLGVVGMFISAKLLGLFGLEFGYVNQLHDFILLTIHGLVTCGVYLVITESMGMLKSIFGVSTIEIINIFKRKVFKR